MRQPLRSVHLYFLWLLTDTNIEVAYAFNYAKATAFAVNKDLTLLANFEKMFPFIFIFEVYAYLRLVL